MVSLWQYYGDEDEPALEATDNIIDFPNDNNDNISFKLEEKITGQTRKDGTKDVEIMIPLKYLIFGEILKCHQLIVKLILS